jgi:predicted DNA binding CopG/RHH family protein
MRIEYDLSRMKSRRNSCASKPRKPVTMRLSGDVVIYFKGMAAEPGVPCRTLINLYLRDSVTRHRQVQIAWPAR